MHSRNTTGGAIVGEREEGGKKGRERERERGKEEVRRGEEGEGRKGRERREEGGKNDVREGAKNKKEEGRIWAVLMHRNVLHEHTYSVPTTPTCTLPLL